LVVSLINQYPIPVCLYVSVKLVTSAVYYLHNEYRVFLENYLYNTGIFFFNSALRYETTQ